MPKHPQFSITIPAQKLRRLNQVVKDEERSRSQYVRRLIERDSAEREGKAIA
jgi:metal-responsive CopG/Arc/MetJ family transcriptional regulator